MDIRDKRDSRGASIPNRIRFMKKAKESLRRIVDEALQGDKVISDSTNGRKVSIPVDGIEEPFLRRSSSGGDHHYVLPGNDRYAEGDQISRPKSGAGSGGTCDNGQGGEDGAGKGQGGQDSFQFIISREEFLELFFEDCELPNMKKQTFGKTEQYAFHRSGFSKSGSPSQLDLIRTMRQSLGRRVALGRPTREELSALEEAIQKEESENGETAQLCELREQYARLSTRHARIPFIEPDHDVRFRRFEKMPKPILRAVMFCLMDVSGSMDEERKNNAKRFFLLLRLFLENRYKHVDVVFIRHATYAEEVDEETFFLSRETGGTMVSSALEEMQKVIHNRYSSEWNIYAAQASDGDNYAADNPVVMSLLTEIFPLLQYYAYIEVGDHRSPSSLWRNYEQIQEEGFAMKRVEIPEDVVRVFYKLFSRTKT